MSKPLVNIPLTIPINFDINTFERDFIVGGSLVYNHSHYLLGICCHNKRGQMYLGQNGGHSYSLCEDGNGIPVVCFPTAKIVAHSFCTSQLPFHPAFLRFHFVLLHQIWEIWQAL